MQVPALPVLQLRFKSKPWLKPSQYVSDSWVSAPMWVSNGFYPFPFTNPCLPICKKNYPWKVFSTQHLWTAKSRCFAWSSPCSSTAPALHLGAPHGSRRRLSRPCAARGGPAESTCHRRGLGFRASGIQGLGNWGWTAVGGWLLFNHQKNGRFWKRHIKSNTKIVIKCCCHSGMQLGLIFTGIYSITMVTEPAI